MSLTPPRIKRLVAYRERLERLQEERLGAALRRQAERAAALATIQREREDLLDSRAPAAGAIEPELLGQLSAYAMRLERDISAREAALNASVSEVSAERDRLMALRRDRKAMEALLERRLAEERLLRQRRTRQQLDEVASRRWFDHAG